MRHRRQAPNLCRTNPRRKIPSPLVTPASEPNQRGHVMSTFEFRLGIAAILVAIVLAVLGSFTANAGGGAGGGYSKAAGSSSPSAADDGAKSVAPGLASGSHR